MTSLQHVLEQRLQQGIDARDSWDRAACAMEEVLGATAALKAGVPEHRRAIDAALDKFRTAVATPTLVIATTGTTSGGKSAIVNYLCGAAAMPSAVQELSAGVVTLEHDPARCRLRVEKTEGATWPCGEWDLDVDEIRSRLKAVMDQYREQREREGIKPPRFTVGMNTRFGRDLATLGLPAGTRVVLLDLPGLNHMGDRSNGDVIREQVRSALCLVTYNAANPDKTLQAELLEQVVRQVKALGGSPARMLFVANRIDEFLKDENAALESGRFVAQVTQDIRARVARELPEHSEAARSLVMQKFSSEPALLALQLTSADERIRTAAVKRIRKFYVALLPEAMQAAVWSNSFSAEQAATLRQILLDASHANAFDEVLRSHIEKNLPDLILPQLVADLADHLSGALGGMEASLRARLAAARQKLDAELARIGQAADQLATARAGLLKLLAPLMDDSLDSNSLPLAVKKVEELNGLKTYALSPLATWQDTLNRVATETTTVLNKALENRQAIDAKDLPFVDGSHCAKLNEALAALRDAGWTGQRKKVELKGDQGRANTRKLVAGLRGLGKALVPVMRDALDAAAAGEGNRIESALGVLLRAQSRMLSDDAQRMVPELRVLQMPPLAISRIRDSLRWDIQFDIDADANTMTKSEKVATKDVQKSKGVWWTFFIYKKTWTETEDVFADVAYHSVELPSASDLCENLLQQFKESRPEHKFLGWLRRQLRAFADELAKFHDDRLRAYRAELNQLRTKVEGEQEVVIARLETLEVQVREAMRTAKALRERG
jgi:Dynamin family